SNPYKKKAEIILRSRGPGRVSWLFFNISGGRKEKTEVGEVPRGLLLLSDCPAIQAWRAPVAPGLGRCSHQACQGAKHPSMDIPRSLLEARQALKTTTNIVTRTQSLAAPFSPEGRDIRGTNRGCLILLEDEAPSHSQVRFSSSIAL
ncbi:hypothetical protein ILYODFUR_027024, partial [Ilyodon furcidens]